MVYSWHGRWQVALLPDSSPRTKRAVCCYFSADRPDAGSVYMNANPFSLVRELNNRNISCAHLSSSQTTTEYRSVLMSLRRTPCPYRLLYVTPERFQVSEFVDVLQKVSARNELVCIAVDEAHCIST